ncbi:MAG: hypothetical protein ACLUEQ_11380 [Cloacibacillus evryensis]
MGSHEMFLAKIIAVNVSEKLLDAKGVLHRKKRAGGDGARQILHARPPGGKLRIFGKKR